MLHVHREGSKDYITDTTATCTWTEQLCRICSFLHYLYVPGLQFCCSQSTPFNSIQVTQSLALTPTLSADISSIPPPLSLYNCIKWCWKSVCPIRQPFLLEAPDTPVHRSWTQLKWAICVKFIMPRPHCHWLRAHQAPPLSPALVQPGPWEVSGHFCYCSFWFISLIEPKLSRETGPAAHWE